MHMHMVPAFISSEGILILINRFKHNIFVGASKKIQIEHRVVIFILIHYTICMKYPKDPSRIRGAVQVR
jgi:hypothetical protein